MRFKTYKNPVENPDLSMDFEKNSMKKICEAKVRLSSNVCN
jgi:hypothetical protein